MKSLELALMLFLAMSILPSSRPTTTTMSDAQGLILEKHGGVLLLASTAKIGPSFEISLPDDLSVIVDRKPASKDDLHVGMNVNLIRSQGGDGRPTLYASDGGVGIVDELTSEAVIIRPSDLSKAEITAPFKELRYARVVARGFPGTPEPISIVAPGMLVAPYYVGVRGRDVRHPDHIIQGLLILSLAPTSRPATLPTRPPVSRGERSRRPYGRVGCRIPRAG